MAAQAEAQVLGLELERVLPNVPTLFDREGTFYRELERRPVEIVSKRDMRIPLELRPGGNFGHFDPDGGDLGRGTGPVFDKATITPAFLKIGFEFTTLAHWVTDDRRKAVLNNFRNLLAKGMAEFRRHCDSLCMTAGNGVLGTITTVAAATNDTYTLTTDGFGTRLLRFGQYINVYNAGLTTNRTTGAERPILVYDHANKTIQVLAVAGAAPTDKIVVSGLDGAAPASIKGVPYHNSNASTGYWLGFPRATTPEIRANAVNASGSALTLPLPRLAINKIGDRVGLENTSKVQAWCHPCQEQAYEQLGMLVTQINTTGGNKGLDLYFGGPKQIAGAPLKKSFSWDKTRIDFIDLNVWGRAVMHEASFYTAPEDGKRIFEIRGASGGVACSNIFYYVAAFDIFMNNPAAGSYIYGLAVPSGY